jgi:hypothetical protein
MEAGIAIGDGIDLVAVKRMTKRIDGRKGVASGMTWERQECQLREQCQG